MRKIEKEQLKKKLLRDLDNLVFEKQQRKMREKVLEGEVY